MLFDDEGRPKIADFGIARMTSGEGTLTEAGTVLGTAAYISPEQATGAPASTASDVYSFGVILYRMLTGRLPFESSDPMQLVIQHRDEPPPPVASLRSDAPAVLEATATAALAKDPRARPPDGAALLAELGVPAGAGVTTATAVLAGDATAVLPAAGAAPAYEAFPEPPPSRSRLPLVAAAILVLALAGAALAYEVTRPNSAPGDTGTFTPITLPSESKTTATTAPTTAATTTTTPSTTAATTATATTTATPPTTTAAPIPTTAPPTTTAPLPTTQPPPTTTVAPPTTTAAGATTTAPAP